MPQKRDKNSDFSKDFRKKMSELRKKTGMTQIEFAKFVGVSSSSIGLYETGERIPDAEILCRIAEKCNVSADYLLGLQKEPVLNEDIKAIHKYTGLSKDSIEVLQEWNYHAKNPHFHSSSKTDTSDIINRKYSNLLKTLDFLLCEPKEKHKRLLFECISDLFNVDFSKGNTITISEHGDILSINNGTDKIRVRQVEGAEWCIDLNSGMLFKQYLLNQINEIIQNKCEAYKKEYANGKHN